jgi:hypothetical protein
MHPPTRLFSILVISCLVFAPLLRAQDNPLNDPDLKKMLKEAQEIQKKAKELQEQNPTSPDTKKKLAEMVSQAKEEEARQEEQEKRGKEKLQAATRSPGPGRVTQLDTGYPRIQGCGGASEKNHE